MYCVYTHKPQHSPHNTTWEVVCDKSIPNNSVTSASAAHPALSSLKYTIQCAPAMCAPGAILYALTTTFDLLYWQSNSSNVKSNEQTLPKEGKHYTSEADAPTFKLKGSTTAHSPPSFRMCIVPIAMHVKDWDIIHFKLS